MRTGSSIWLAALLVMALLACKESSGSKEGTAATSTATPSAAVAPGRPFVKTGYQLHFGPAVSAKDPKPSDFKDSIPPGYVAMRFEADDGGLGVSKVRVSLYRVTESGKSIETQKVSEFDPKMDYFAKSWEITRTGRYEVKIEDPAASEVLAIGQFDIVD